MFIFFKRSIWVGILFLGLLFMVGEARAADCYAKQVGTVIVECVAYTSSNACETRHVSAGDCLERTPEGCASSATEDYDWVCLNCGVNELCPQQVIPPGGATLCETNADCGEGGKCVDNVCESNGSPGTSATSISCENFTEMDCKENNNQCFWFATRSKCVAKDDSLVCSELPKDLCGPNNSVGSKVCVLSGETCQAPVNDINGGGPSTQNYGRPPGYVGALPDCAFSGTCRNINDLLNLVVNFASGFFAILGTFAFAYFVYGGFTMILSFGSAEKVKKGRDTLIAAVIGLLICFVAYAAVKFMLVDVLKVSSDFNVIK